VGPDVCSTIQVGCKGAVSCVPSGAYSTRVVLALVSFCLCVYRVQSGGFESLDSSC